MKSLFTFADFRFEFEMLYGAWKSHLINFFDQRKH